MQGFEQPVRSLFVALSMENMHAIIPNMPSHIEAIQPYVRRVDGVMPPVSIFYFLLDRFSLSFISLNERRLSLLNAHGRQASRASCAR